MSVALRSVSIVCVVLSACTPGGEPVASEPASPMPEEPALVVERDVSELRLELGPALGGSALIKAPSPGRYAVEVRFTQHRFVTMEHTVSEALEGSAVLELTDTGEARACFAVRDSSASDISHYQAHDGQDHHYENAGDRLLGARGSWASIQGTNEIELRLDRLDYRSCEVGDEVAVSAEPLTLRCLGLASTSKIPSAGLLCQAGKDQRLLGNLSLVLGEQARSWGLRVDLAHGEPRPGDEDEPRLLLGTGDGLRVSGSDERGGLELELEVERAKVPAPKPPVLD